MKYFIFLYGLMLCVTASAEKKIVHYGKRADAIVKGMLQHSGKNTEQKEPTDINALCDEYLRPAYHGVRAKNSAVKVERAMKVKEHAL